MPEIRLPSAKGSALDATEAPKTWLRSRRTSAGNFSLTNAYNRDSTDLTAAQTVTIPAVATLIAACETSDFETTLNNVSSVACTLAVTGSDTIGGVNSNYIIGPYQSVTIRINQAGDGVTIISNPIQHSGKYTTKSSSFTVGPEHNGGIIGVAAATAVTATLPAVADAGNGFKVTLICTNATALVTIDGDGSETINVAGANSASITLNAVDDRVTLVCNGTNWDILEEKRTFYFETFLTAAGSYGDEDRAQFSESAGTDIGSNFNSTQWSFICPVGGDGYWSFEAQVGAANGLTAGEDWGQEFAIDYATSDTRRCIAQTRASANDDNIQTPITITRRFVAGQTMVVRVRTDATAQPAQTNAKQSFFRGWRHN